MHQKYVQKTIIIELEAPKMQNIKDKIKWFCGCLGLDSEKDKLAFEIFLYLMDANRRNEGIKTIDITKNCGVTQAAVVYHMNTFIRSGLAVKKGAKYYLRGGTLSETIDRMEDDIRKRMNLLKQIAKKIDEEII